MTNNKLSRVREWQYSTLGGAAKYTCALLGIYCIMENFRRGSNDLSPVIACGLGMAVGEAMQRLPYVFKQKSDEHQERTSGSELEKK